MTNERKDSTAIHLTMIDVERRNYGRRYTGLPVDSLDQQHFCIDCTGMAMRPTMYDIREGDLVRWRHNGRYVQGHVRHVERSTEQLHATLDDVAPLPPEFFAG